MTPPFPLPQNPIPELLQLGAGMVGWKKLSLLVVVASGMAGMARAEGREVARDGNLEMHCMALPTSELTPEAAEEFNVAREATRGLLTVTFIRHLGRGETRAEAGQVFAAVIGNRNNLASIPMRETRRGDAVYYLGEFRVAQPDSLRFLVNGNLGSKVLRTDFSRQFGNP